MNRLLSLGRIKQFIECRPFSVMKISADGKDIPKKKVFEARITLIGTDNSITITDLKSAQNISTRRDLKLVKIQDEDSKTRRPVYKMMTNAEYHEEELSKRKKKQESKDSNTLKGQKLLTFSSRIAEHDLMTSIKKIGKLLEKQYEVKVVISGDDSEGSSKYDKIYSAIESNLLSCAKIVQKRQKGSTLRLQLQPVRQNTSNSGKETDSNKNNNSNGPL